MNNEVMETVGKTRFQGEDRSRKGGKTRGGRRFGEVRTRVLRDRQEDVAIILEEAFSRGRRPVGGMNLLRRWEGGKAVPFRPRLLRGEYLIAAYLEVDLGVKSHKVSLLHQRELYGSLKAPVKRGRQLDGFGNFCGKDSCQQGFGLLGGKISSIYV